MKKSEVLAFIKALKTLRDGADDKLASLAVSLYPKLKK